jgi:transcriptional regulator with XRE-family HTH domain
MNTQTKITLTGSTAAAEIISGPKWVATKTRTAWAHGAVIAESRRQGRTLQTLAEEYGVSIGTIDRIAEAQPQPLAHDRRALLNAKALLDAVQAARDARNDMAAQLLEAQHDLANAKLGEASAIARLNDPSVANKWKAEAHQEYLRRDEAERDRAAAEAQIEMMAERLAECRGRGFWARVFNR